MINVSSDTLEVTVTDSTIVGNARGGILTSSDSVPSQLMLKNIVAANNGGPGIFNSGAAASTRIGDSMVTGNTTGIENFGGSFTSYKNNQIRFNTVDGTPLAPETPNNGPVPILGSGRRVSSGTLFSQRGRSVVAGAERIRRHRI